MWCVPTLDEELYRAPEESAVYEKPLAEKNHGVRGRKTRGLHQKSASLAMKPGRVAVGSDMTARNGDTYFAESSPSGAAFYPVTDHRSSPRL